MPPKKATFAVLALLIVAGFIMLFNKPDNSPKPDAFAGTIERIEGNTIYAKGALSKEGMPFSTNDDVVSVQIKVESGTDLKKISIMIPSGAASFNTRDLEQVESKTTIEEIDKEEHTVGIEAVIDQSRFKSNSSFSAKSIDFRVPVFK